MVNPFYLHSSEKVASLQQENMQIYIISAYCRIESTYEGRLVRISEKSNFPIISLLHCTTHSFIKYIGIRKIGWH